MSIEQFTRGFCVPRDIVVDGISANSEQFENIAEDAISKFVACANDGQTLKGDRRLKEKHSGYTYSRGDLINDVARILGRNPANKQQESLDDIPEDLGGLGGFSFISAFKGYLIRRDEVSVGFLNSGEKTIIKDQYRNKLCGKLKDFVFFKEGENEGRVIGSGHLSVDVFEEEYFTTANFLACRPDKVTLLHWDITVPSCLYVVHDRDDSSFPDKPFPSLPELDFPDYATDPGDARSLWCRGLNRKLYARGPQIKISHVYRQICEIDSAGEEVNGLFELIGASDPDHDLYYKTTNNSCIDIMFKGEPPATQLPPQVEYCMGRCEHPPIINSGGG